MSEIAGQTGRATVGSQQIERPAESVADQALETVQEGAESVQEKAQELRAEARDRVRSELDTRSTDVGVQLQGAADAMRRSGTQLRQEGNDRPAQVTEYMAQKAERLGRYLSDANSDQMLRDVESFARRQPWLVAAGGATLGFIASRFLKASSSNRYPGAVGQVQNRAWQPGSAPSAGTVKSEARVADSEEGATEDRAGYAMAGTERGASGQPAA